MVMLGFAFKIRGIWPIFWIYCIFILQFFLIIIRMHYNSLQMDKQIITSSK